MVIDWDINVGHLFTITATVVCMTAIIVTVRTKVDTLAKRMESVESKMEHIVQLMVSEATQNERLNGMDNRLTLFAQAHEEIKKQLDRLFVPSDLIRK